MTNVRRKCFISYHHADGELVNQFVKKFDHERNTFIARGLGEEMPGEIIQSTDTDYVMRCIREKYLRDSTVTIVLIGRCTWSRRYVDWELQSSLRHGDKDIPNGLLGIRLPTCTEINEPQLPKRFLNNINNGKCTDCYAKYINYPSTNESLVREIEAAYQRRTTHAHLITNPRESMLNNIPC